MDGTLNATDSNQDQANVPAEEEVVQPQVVVVQPPRNELLPQEQQPAPQQVMMVQQPQYQQPQQQLQPQQVMMVPTHGQLQYQPSPVQQIAVPSDNPYAASNNVVNAKRKEYMIGVDTGYFRVKPELDKLDEMKPWESDGQSYSFACCCEYLDLEAFNGVAEMKADNRRASLATTLEGKKSQSQSVYHKTNSDMLTVIKKEYKSSASSFDFKTKNNKTCLWIMLGVCSLLLLVGIIVAASSEEEDPCADYWYSGCQYDEPETPAGLIAGIIIAVIGGLGLLCVLPPLFCNNKKITALSSDSQQELEIKSYSIPLFAVYAVQRKATEKRTTAVVAVSEACNCCGPKKPQESTEQKDELCEVTIRYKRDDGDLSALGEQVGTIEVKVTPHQGFNLQRYLNCVIDGSHPKWKPEYGSENANKYSLELKKTV
eukprot:CAMPEP_0202698588 /NCGR_PEP_ID=MMETSP1385-20130828/11861_1 /ASSEMBLY_ACC=CAM_ASM_000861 /TAXON_ID=933848 /ORGANISM="Elphidium margaritaceum" /LENGTH=427 /DNA_ID=CAMNT_0049355341 /DNA_START=175 /DNA_END=1458 /DNA_ORIENTATION=-